jgi:hypothetical protein
LVKFCLCAQNESISEAGPWNRVVHFGLFSTAKSAAYFFFLTKSLIAEGFPCQQGPMQGNSWLAHACGPFFKGKYLLSLLSTGSWSRK